MGRVGITKVMKKVLIFMLTISLWSPLPMAHAVRNPALQALETLRHGFADVADFTAEITQEKHLSLMKRKMVSRGVVRFKKPGIFYLELYPPHASRLMLNDNVVTVRYPKEGITDRFVLPAEEGLQKWLTFLARPVTALPEGVDVRAERQGDLWTLSVLPRSKGGVRELRLVYDGDGKIRTLTIVEQNSDRTVISFHNLRRNAGLKEQDFQVD
jgi:outer membrane lipoprotein carrier protein